MESRVKKKSEPAQGSLELADAIEFFAEAGMNVVVIDSLADMERLMERTKVIEDEHGKVVVAGKKGAASMDKAKLKRYLDKIEEAIDNAVEKEEQDLEELGDKVVSILNDIRDELRKEDD